MTAVASKKVDAQHAEWALFTLTAGAEHGPMTKFTKAQRFNVKGGAPTTSCTTGATLDVVVEADYYFYE